MNDLSTSIDAPKPSHLPIREEDFCKWVGQAEPGDGLCYHRGYLAVDREINASALASQNRRAIDATADRAYALAAEGRLLLVQQRHGPCDYSYFAIIAQRFSRSKSVTASVPERKEAA